jgi:hypothetical protein
LQCQLPHALHCLLHAAAGTLEAAGPAALAASRGIDHWAVRYNAAQLVAQVCVRFGDPYYNVQVCVCQQPPACLMHSFAVKDAGNSHVRSLLLVRGHRYLCLFLWLQPRISKTLLRALLDTSKPLATHYGKPVSCHSMVLHGYEEESMSAWPGFSEVEPSCMPMKLAAGTHPCHSLVSFRCNPRAVSLGPCQCAVVAPAPAGGVHVPPVTPAVRGWELQWLSSQWLPSCKWGRGVRYGDRQCGRGGSREP